MYGNNNNIRTGNQIAPSYIPNTLGKKPLKVRDSLGAVPREVANLEAEGGETVLIPNKQGGPAHYNIRGNRHFEGGVALAVPPESFIYSDTKSMKIKDPVLLAEFGMPERKGGYTPAEIAKKYDLNTYRKILHDPNSDALQVNTAEMVIANYNVKLGKLAMIQESMKGFPGGIATASMPYMAKYNLEPEMFLPRDMNPQPEGAPQAGQEEMMEMQQGAMGNQQAQMMAPQPPMARRGGQMNHLRQYQPGGTTGREDVYNPRMERRMERRARRTAEREYYNNYYRQLLEQVQNEPDYPAYDRGPRPDASTGIYVRKDANGNTYYEDGRGVRIDNLDNISRNSNADNYVLAEGEKIVTKNGKRYIVKKVTKPAVADKTKVKAKNEATAKGDIYEEDGKYYQVQEYDVTKPIASTKSGKTNYTGDLEEDKKKAKVILDKVAAAGGAEYHDAVWTLGGNTYQPGWHIKDSARNKMTTAEKDFLTKFLSYGSESNVLGVPGEKEYQVALQSSGETGFFGYTDPKFYEYRFWQARNPGKTADDWDAASADDKLKNRKNMFYSLGMDINDPHISANISNPDNLYTPQFVKGAKRVRTAREIKDKDGNVVSNLNYVDAVENFFNPGEFRPGLSDDKKLGLEHADAFTFDRKVNPLEPTEEETERLLEEDTKYNPKYQTGRPTPDFIQDRILEGNAMRNMYNINRYYPSLQTYEPYLPEPVPYNPEQEIQANNALLTEASDAFRGTSGSSQALGAKIAGASGNLADNVAKIMGKYNNLNVGTANEFAYKQADIMNDAQKFNAGQMMSYVDKVNTTNQNYDNAKREARDAYAQAEANRITNRAKAQVLNTMYPEYAINPAAGGELFFAPNRQMVANENAMISHNDAQQFAEFLRENPDLARDYAPALASVWTKGKGVPGMANPMDSAFYNAYSGMMPGMAETPPGNNPNYYMEEGGVVPYSYIVGLL
jgi:hypothetical protein